MNSEITNLLITFVIVAGITLLILTDNNPQNGVSPYWLILALSLPQILRAFPKIRKLGVGTSQFIPNLYTHLQKKLRRTES